MSKDWCQYAFVASRHYFPGLLVVLYSLLEQHRGLPDCRALTLIWHPSLADTVLQPAQRRAIECLATAHGRQLDYLAADDARLRIWSQLPSRDSSSAVLGMLKLEVLFAAQADDRVVVYIDSDMLVLQPIDFVADCVRPLYARPWMAPVHNACATTAAQSQGRWALHGSCPVKNEKHSVCPPHVQTGFFAFRTPVQAGP